VEAAVKRLLLSIVLVCCGGAKPTRPPAAPAASAFILTKAMIPMRDGVRLETLIVTPREATKPLPFLLTRSPYGIPKDEKPFLTPRAAVLNADGYIMVFQNLRGRFNSEGTFVMGKTPRDRDDPQATDEATDAHDTIDWLLENVPNHNGRVGMIGTSYSAWTATMALLNPHPALKAVCEQASPADLFIGDDFFHNGAFRLAYAFEYVALLQSEKEANTKFKFGRRDIYDFYLALGPLPNADARHFHGKMPAWNDFVAHPNRDALWERQAFATHLRKTTVPVLNVGGWWDQEDFYGPLKIYELLEADDAANINSLVVGPWNHGGWHGDGRRLGDIDFGSDTGTYYHQQIVAPWLAHWLHDKGKPSPAEATVFETGTNRWRSFDRWPPEAGVVKKKLYLRAGKTLSLEPPAETGADAADSFVSDPASPVPFSRRPIPPLFQAQEWPVWLVQDQRFVDGRPDVLSFTGDVLDRDVAVAGNIVADLYASTSGTDSDWVVKLIDVYPDGEPPAGTPTAPDLRGYQLMIAGEILRGRFRDSFARPTPIPSGKVVKYTIDLRGHAHVFRKGHRIMVQVQSTWFPAYDRNPQRYVDNIFKATEGVFHKATQRVARSREAPSAIVLPVLLEPPVTGNPRPGL